jgi:hypothetical protein
MGGYPTNSEVLAILDGWAAQYPNLITPRFSIGTTIEGRDIWAVKISDNPNVNENEPECHYDSLVHAREAGGMTTLIYFMQALLENYGVDPELTYLVDNREIFFVPVHNPDGYQYNEQTNPNGGGMWRKNRRDNGDGTYGVDLNRNYGFKWGYDNNGSSPYPYSDTYRGTGPFSEPETQAVRDFLTASEVTTAWNTHTYGNMYLCPFGYDNVLPYGNDWPIYQEWLADISADNGYAAGPVPQVIGYYANGGAVDWHYGDQGIFGISPEIGDDFWPPQSDIIPMAEENFPAIKYWTWVAGSYVLLQDYDFSDANGDGLYYPGEPISVTLTLRNKGLAATTGDVIATMTSSSPYAVISGGTHNFGPIASVTDADNSGSPIQVELAGHTPYGEVVDFDVEVSFDGHVLTLPISVTCGAPQIWFQDNFETNQGWTVQNQNVSTGAWERADPNPTSGGQYAPLEDNPAGTGTMCFVTENGPVNGSYSSYDLDGGPTHLISPTLDLTGSDATVSAYCWFYTRDGDDSKFEISLSNDNGSSWTVIYTTNSSLNGWTQLSFLVSDYVTPNAQVKVRFSAQDYPNDDIVEAGVDDFEVKTFEAPISLALAGPPAVGTTVGIDVDAPSDGGLKYILVASRSTWPPVIYDGVIIPVNNDNIFQKSRDPGSKVFNNFTGFLNGAGYSGAPSIKIPNNAGLIGMELFLAAVTLEAGGPPPTIKNVSAPLRIVIE